MRKVDPKRLPGFCPSVPFLRNALGGLRGLVQLVGYGADGPGTSGIMILAFLYRQGAWHVARHIRGRRTANLTWEDFEAPVAALLEDTTACMS